MKARTAVATENHERKAKTLSPNCLCRHRTGNRHTVIEKEDKTAVKYKVNNQSEILRYNKKFGYATHIWGTKRNQLLPMYLSVAAK